MLLLVGCSNKKPSPGPIDSGNSDPIDSGNENPIDSGNADPIDSGNEDPIENPDEPIIEEPEIKKITDLYELSSVQVLEENRIVESDEYDNKHSETTTKFIFIFDSTDTRNIEEIYGNTACKNGYFYIKKYDNDKIYLLAPCPVSTFYEIYNEGAFFAMETGLYYVDFETFNIYDIAPFDKQITTRIISNEANDTLYYGLGNEIYILDIYNKSLANYLFDRNIISVSPLGDNLLLLNDGELFYGLNTNTMEYDIYYSWGDIPIPDC